MYATMKQRTDWMPAVRHKRSQNAGVVYTLAEEVVPVDALMRISFRTKSDATRGIAAEQNIRDFRPMSAAMSACRNWKLAVLGHVRAVLALPRSAEEQDSLN